jgi:hypothetical protein
MGIIADTMAEVVDRTQNTMEGAATTLQTATTCELVTAAGGVVHVNVDGVLALSIQACASTIVTATMAEAEGRFTLYDS